MARRGITGVWVVVALAARVAGAAPLGETLAKEVGAGAEVAILAGAEGVVAVSDDGARKKVVVPGAAAWAYVDRKAQVIWFGKASGKTSEIWLVDLMAETATPEKIVSGLPADESVEIEYSEAESLYDGNVSFDTRAVLFVVAKAKGVGAFSGLMEMVDPKGAASHEKALKKAKLAKGAQKRLAALLGRGAERALESSPPAAPVCPRVVQVLPQACEDSSLCGTADVVPGNQKIWRVIVGHGCGDGCYTTTQLYDPFKKEFFDPAQPKTRSKKPISGASFGRAYVSPRGDAYVSEGKIYRFDKGEVAAGGTKGGGWLSGGWYVE